MICLQINGKVHLACNFNCIVKFGGLPKVIGGHIHCRCDNMLEMVHNVVATEH